MSTFRVAERRRFTVLDNEMVLDKRLSFRARGVLMWLLAKPDDWRCDAATIARDGQEGRDAVRTALRELESCGYLHRVREQDPEDGRWRTRVDVYETPEALVVNELLSMAAVRFVAHHPSSDTPYATTSNEFLMLAEQAYLTVLRSR